MRAEVRTLFGMKKSTRELTATLGLTTKGDRTTFVISVMIVLAICLFFVTRPLVALFGFSDTEGQPLLHTSAAVDSITYLPGRKADPAPLPIFHFRIGEQLAEFRSGLNLQPGQHLNLSYRVGKSGTIYIEGIDP